jgi:hypothetical protein
MTRTAFTTDDLVRWYTALEQASTPPTIAEALTAPQALGVNGRARRTGVTIGLTDDTGRHTVLTLNPVAAIALMRVIREAGRQMGWLTEQGHIAFPPEE